MDPREYYVQDMAVQNIRILPERLESYFPEILLLCFFYFRDMNEADYYCFKAVPLSSLNGGTSQCEVII